jgi:16S rRNA (guanine966-N2)-methyltransferase
MDAPYHTGLAQQALDHVAGRFWLAPGAWLSVELSGEEVRLPDGVALEADRRFGKARILLLRRAG